MIELNKSTYVKTVIWIAIISLIILGIIKKDFEDEIVSTLWQFVVAIAIQLVVYENEIL